MCFSIYMSFWAATIKVTEINYLLLPTCKVCETIYENRYLQRLVGLVDDRASILFAFNLLNQL